MNRRPKTFWTTVIIVAAAVVLLTITLLLDYLNIPTRLGISIDNFNMDVQAIIINAIITVSMFLTTYYLITRWDNRRHKNRQDTAEMLLRKTYGLCEKYILKLDDEYSSELSFQIKKGGEIDTAAFFSNYEKIPFDNDAIIMQFFSDGTLSGHQMSEYIRIKGLYSAYVSLYDYFRKTKENEKLGAGLRDMIVSTIRNESDAL